MKYVGSYNNIYKHPWSVIWAQYWNTLRMLYLSIIQVFIKYPKKVIT